MHDACFLGVLGSLQNGLGYDDVLALYFVCPLERAFERVIRFLHGLLCRAPSLLVTCKALVV